MHQPTLKKALAAAPDIVFITIGGNDIEAESKPRDIFNGIVSLVETLRGSGATRLQKSFLGSSTTVFDRQRNKIFDRHRNKISAILRKEYDNDCVRFPDIILYTLTQYASRIRRCLHSS
ncbi:hypothetical protein KP79_PYT16133 [Mizuhopecten yessoensis]|uniref:Uncharacterized protein n=1 Tax=Mizuhopecten yessoensis TaxID=6573 RepID=A0A210PV76_MIZYE|nr:hypothetical protein KP79_PYT16133 [Mizuhopecten yessoensis]